MTWGAGYGFLLLPQEFKPEPNAPPPSALDGSPHTQLLWPEKVGPAEVERLKATLGSYRYAGEYQQRPSPAEGGMFKRHWWRF